MSATKYAAAAATATTITADAATSISATVDAAAPAVAAPAAVIAATLSATSCSGGMAHQTWQASKQDCSLSALIPQHYTPDSHK